MKKNQIDFILCLSIVILVFVGCIMVYSSSQIIAEFRFDDQFKFIKQQGLFAILGLGIMYVITKVNYSFYKKHANLIFIVSLLLLILVLIPGLGVVRGGSRSWFKIGSFQIQPSEFMKIGLVIFIAKYIDNSDKLMKQFVKGFVFPALLILIVFAVIMLQPDFGTGFVLLVTCFCMLFVSGTNLRVYIYLFFVGVLGIVGLIISAPYRLKRIYSFLNPWEDPLGSGFQIIQSLYAIGPGGFFGFGFLNSRQKHFFLPEPQTDFIFSIIAEELGFLGVSLVIFLYATIFLRGIKIALNTNDTFAKFLCFGLIFQITIQTLINLMVVSGLIPVTGVTLPLLSYGGSSLITTLISLGIVLNISRSVN